MSPDPTELPSEPWSTPSIVLTAVSAFFLPIVELLAVLGTLLLAVLMLAFLGALSGRTVPETIRIDGIIVVAQASAMVLVPSFPVWAFFGALGHTFGLIAGLGAMKSSARRTGIALALLHVAALVLWFVIGVAYIVVVASVESS